VSEKESLKIRWIEAPEDKDFPAARKYLSLVFGSKRAAGIVSALRTAPADMFEAKDILRASQLTLLGIDNKHVEKDRKKIKEGEALSPILLVRDRRNRRVIVADGYHRLCAVYAENEDAWIPCRIV